MSVFSITNIPELRSVFFFNRLSFDISEIVRRLETGQRIITGKDDPAGLLSRELMRTDIRGIQAAQKNTMVANELLSSADSGLANISRMLLGDIHQRDDTGLLGLIYDDTLPTDMKRQQINDILNLIDGTIRTSTYNGQQILNGSMGYRLTGMDSGKLSDVSVSAAAFSSSKGLPVTIVVLEQVSDTVENVRVTINGREVQGNGRQVEYSADGLTMSATISAEMKVGERTQFNVAGGMLFQLGKEVQTSSQYRMILPSMTVSHLGGASGVLEDLRTIDLDTDAGKAKAYSIIHEAVTMVATQRGKIGAVQTHVLESNARNLDIQLEKTMEAEALISNADMALESSRLSRAEILAQSAMRSILYSRSFGQFILNALL